MEAREYADHQKSQIANPFYNRAKSINYDALNFDTLSRMTPMAGYNKPRINLEDDVVFDRRSKSTM